MSKYPAHISEGKTQTVEEHCRNTAKYAAEALSSVTLSETAYLAGLAHDAGKFTQKFKDYIIRSANGENTVRGSVNHTFTGVRILLGNYHKQEAPSSSQDIINNITTELLSLAVGSHHGLFDCFDQNQRNGFIHRMNKPDIDYDNACKNFYEFCADKNELDKRFSASVSEIESIFNNILNLSTDITNPKIASESELYFYLGLLSRLILSAVIEGDRRDTAEFMSGVKFTQTPSKTETTQLWENCLKRTEEKLAQFPKDTEIQKARNTISERCKAFASEPGGIYRLNVPTGGGKTLSSLRYALAHAAKHGKQRIIFTSPLLSILEQNAAVIRSFIQDDSIILEHHSNLSETNEESEELDNRELLIETYDSPIIITTLVQLLNILFSGKTSSIRRFHSLCNSIIVIDEVQTVPSNMLSLFSLAMNFLSEICGASVILCSATQPCLETIEHKLREPIKDIIKYDPIIWSAFKRTDIQNINSLDLGEIAEFSINVLNETQSLLVICNKKDEAAELYKTLNNFGGDCYHLSASMCIAHRTEVLKNIKNSLEKSDGTKTLCISTQLIEAGVDISFERVIRLSAGMDSVIQAAGRCNRNGEAGKNKTAPVYLVECIGENLANLPDIQRGKQATLALIAEYNQHPDQFQNSLDSDTSINYYYRCLYKSMGKNYRDYFVKKESTTLFSLLSSNQKYVPDNPQETGTYFFRQAFHLAGFSFKVFEDNTTDVIVPYGKGEEIINNLNSGRAEFDFEYVKRQLIEAKPYTVSLYDYQKEKLQHEGSLKETKCGALYLVNHYNENTGFSMNENQLNFLEV